MTPARIIGWKNYAVAGLFILVGLWAFERGNMDGAVKGLLAGLAWISLRDVLGKVLWAVDANCRSIDGLRAAIETELSTREGRQ